MKNTLIYVLEMYVIDNRDKRDVLDTNDVMEIMEIISDLEDKEELIIKDIPKYYLEWFIRALKNYIQKNPNSCIKEQDYLVYIRNLYNS